MDSKRLNGKHSLCAAVLLLMLQLSNTQKTTMTRYSECYTPNGNDYRGTQNTTYVAGDGPYEPMEPQSEVCLPWKDVEVELNATMPENYCRNPNNLLFPYCFVMRDGSPTFTYCHIPSCSETPALLGCFKVLISGEMGGVNSTGPPPDLILDGEDSMNDDPEMRIARCLNFCRSREYDYAGVTGGDTCMCGKRDVDGPQLKDVLNILHPHDCLVVPCSGDRMQACGSDTAIAIYDVEAGSCRGTFHDRDHGTIYSPRWPGDYHNEAQCGWTVYVPDKYKVDKEKMSRYNLVLSFSFYDLEKDNDTIKFYTYQNSTDAHPQLVSKYSGKENPANITLSVAKIHAVHIVFNSDKDDKHDGFILHYDFIDTRPKESTPLPDIVIKDTQSPATTRRTTTIPPKKKTTIPVMPGVTKTTTKATLPTKTPASAPPKISASTGAPQNSTTAKSSLATKKNPHQAGKIAGIVIGVIVLSILIVLGITAFLKYRKHKAEKEAAIPTPPAMFDNPVSFPSDTTL